AAGRGVEREQPLRAPRVAEAVVAEQRIEQRPAVAGGVLQRAAARAQRGAERVAEREAGQAVEERAERERFLPPAGALALEPRPIERAGLGAAGEQVLEHSRRGARGGNERRAAAASRRL